MKKIVGILLSFVFLLSLASNTSFAQAVESPYEEVLFEAAEITNIDALYERAKNGVTDEAGDIFKENISVLGKSDEDIVRSFSTTQKLLVAQKNGEIIEKFKTVTFTVVSKDNENNIIQPFGNKDEDDWDGAYGIRAYSTVYYTRGSTGNLYNYTLDSVSGGWDNIDKQYNLSGRHVKYGVTGNKVGGGIVATHSDKYPTGNSFSYSATSSMAVPVEGRVIMGLNSYITIKRGTNSTWELHHQNNLEYNL